MSETPPGYTVTLLRPSPEETQGVRVMFYTRYATDLSEVAVQKYGYTVFYHRAVHESLCGLGLEVTPASDPQRLFEDLAFDFIYFTQIDDPFLGHEVLIPAIAAYRGVPFLGPAAPVRGLSEDKVLAKALAASLGVEVARHHIIDSRRPAGFKPPPGKWLVKPRTGVMSRDMMLVEGEAAWRSAFRLAADPKHAGREFMAEAYVPGLNLTVPVIEGLTDQALPVFVETGEPRHNILTPTGKEGLTTNYEVEMYQGPGAAEAAATAAKLAAAITPFDYARFDFRFEPGTNRLVFLEVNMNCAMGPHSVVARAAKHLGVDYPELVGHVFTHSFRRQRRAPGA